MAHTPVAPSRSSWPAFAERSRRSLRSGAIGPAATTRVFELHEILAAGRPLNATTFAREHELSTRTVKRDIERLRDFHHAPIVWDARARSYRYTAPFDLLTGLRLGADEALAVVLAGRTFAAWEGTPLGRTLTATLEKVARFAGAAVSFPAADLRAVLELPELQDQVSKAGMLPREPGSVEQLQAFVKSEIARWGDVVRKAGIEGSQ